MQSWVPDNETGKMSLIAETIIISRGSKSNVRALKTPHGAVEADMLGNEGKAWGFLKEAGKALLDTAKESVNLNIGETEDDNTDINIYTEE